MNMEMLLQLIHNTLPPEQIHRLSQATSRPECSQLPSKLHHHLSQTSITLLLFISPVCSRSSFLLFIESLVHLPDELSHGGLVGQPG